LVLVDRAELPVMKLADQILFLALLLQRAVAEVEALPREPLEDPVVEAHT
jgi:hypothetical protein